MDEITIRGSVVSAGGRVPQGGLRVEAWDKDLLVDDFLGEAVSDARGAFEIRFGVERFREVFLDRDPDLYFKIYRGKALICSTESSVLWNRKAGDSAVLIELPVASPRPPLPPPPRPPRPPRPPIEGANDDDPPRYEPDPDVAPITGVAVMSPVFGNGLLIEAFADVDLKERVGWARTDAKGRFEIAPSRGVRSVWLRYSQGEDSGRSPKLQPFDAGQKVRLLAYESRLFRPTGKTRFQGEVSSASGGAVVAAPIVLLEVTLRRCQVLGRAVTGSVGSYLVRYDKSGLWADAPDLQVVVCSRLGEPLVVSSRAAVTLPDEAAETVTLFEKTQAAFAAEGIDGGSLADLEPDELSYVAGRSSVQKESLRAFVAAAGMREEFGVEHAALFALLDSDGPVDPKAALEHAVRSDRLSPSFLTAGKADRIAVRIGAVARRKLLGQDFGRGSLADYLAIGAPDASQREALAGWLFDGLRGEALDDKLREANLDHPRMKMLLALREIIGFNAPLARVLVAPERSGGAQPLRSAEALATWTLRQMKAQVAESYKLLAGDRPTDEQVTREARLLKRRAERRFPTAAFTAELGRHAGRPWARALQAYVRSMPDFDFARPLGATAGDDDTMTGAVLALRRYKNVERFAGMHTAVGALLNAGIGSARAAALMGRAEFAGRFAEAFDGDTVVAGEAHDRANHTLAALNYGASFLPVRGRPALCDCSQCKSLLSPAAYLFELLLLLQRFSDKDAPEGGVLPVSLLAHFSARRPEVTRVKLSCANTNIEVPHIDLVNELLEDWIVGAGHSVSRSLEDGECMPPSHETQGTSHERRAVPQNPPSQRLRELLQGPTVPWSLPYDYTHDLAQSAKRRLLRDPDDFALALDVWRHAVAGGASQQAAAAALARHTLSLTDAQIDLVTTEVALVEVWGPEVEDEVGEGAVLLATLKQVSGRSFDQLEQLLDARFVRGDVAGAEPVAIEPADPCASSDPPRLVGPEAVLRAMLGRAHRFERLRRELGWAVAELDQAIEWLGGSLRRQDLWRLGLLRFLQRKLRISLLQTLGLLRTPSVDTPPTLRLRTIVTAFEGLFGRGSATLVPIDTVPGDADRARAASAQIAAAAGVGDATVDRAFANGFVPGLRSVENLLSAADVNAAYRSAVGAAFRISLWARQLHLSEDALLSLLSLADLTPIPTRTATPSPADALHDALWLVALAEESRDWPLQVTELAYLAGTRAAAVRDHGPTASQVGAWLLELRQALLSARESQKPIPAESRAALGALVGLLLKEAVDERAGQQELDALGESVARNLQWSAFFPDLAERASGLLADRAFGGLDLSTVAVPNSGFALADATDDLKGDDLEGPLTQWLVAALPGLARSPTAWSGALDPLHTALRAAVSHALEDPATADAAPLATALASFAVAAGTAIDASAASTVATRLLRDGVATVEQALQEELRAAAQVWLVPLQSAVHRQVAARTLAAWAARMSRSTEPLAAMLLTELSHPVGGDPIAAAFVLEC